MFVRLFSILRSSCRFRSLELRGLPEYAVVRGLRLRIATVALRNEKFPLFFVRFWPPDSWQSEISHFRFPSSGDFCVVVPPVPIPNTEVKRHSADGSACLACARVGRCQSLCPAPVEKPGLGIFFPFFRRACRPRLDSCRSSERSAGLVDLVELFCARRDPSHNLRRRAEPGLMGAARLPIYACTLPAYLSRLDELNPPSAARCA